MVAARAKLPFIEQMKLFINDIPIYFADNSKAKAGVYDNILDYEKTNLKTSLLIDNVFVKNASSDQLDNLLKIMSSNKLKRLNSITFSLSNYEEAIRIVKKKFSIVKAAGGVVQRDDKTIMIYRLKKWDLPKGKLDKKEKMKQAAVREVEEECNIKVELGPKICNTWHTYTRNGKRVLKKTAARMTVKMGVMALRTPATAVGRTCSARGKRKAGMPLPVRPMMARRRICL